MGGGFGSGPAIGGIPIRCIFRNQFQHQVDIQRGGKELGGHAGAQNRTQRCPPHSGIDLLQAAQPVQIGQSLWRRFAGDYGNNVRRRRTDIDEKAVAIRQEPASEVGQRQPIGGRDLQRLAPGRVHVHKTVAGRPDPDRSLAYNRGNRVQNGLDSLAFAFIAIAQFAGHGDCQDIGRRHTFNQFAKRNSQAVRIFPKSERLHPNGAVAVGRLEIGPADSQAENTGHCLLFIHCAPAFSFPAASLS